MSAATRASVIAREADTKWYEGAGVLESAMGIKDGIAEVDGFSIGANAVALGLGSVGAIMDPFQAVFAAGVGWLMEHVSILREPLDWLAGDPKEIEGHAMTWRNVGGRIFEATDYFVDEVNRSTASWSSQAAAAYRVRAKGHAEQVQALGEITETMAEMTLIAGALVGVVRNTVRDLIAEVIGAAVSKAVQALLVVTIPKIVAEVALMVAEYSSKILGVLKRLIAAIGKLTSKIGMLDGLLAQISKSLDEGISSALILGGHRFDAASDAHIVGRGLTSYRAAYGTISTGNRAVHGGVGQVSVDTAKAAPVSNGVQNAGSVADKIGDEQNPRPIELPL